MLLLRRGDKNWAGTTQGKTILRRALLQLLALFSHLEKSSVSHRAWVLVRLQLLPRAIPS